MNNIRVLALIPKLMSISIFTTILILAIISTLGFYLVKNHTTNNEKRKDFLPDQHKKKQSISRKGGLVIGILGLITLLCNNINTIKFGYTFVFFNSLNLVVFFTGFISFTVGLVDDIMKKRNGLKNSIRIATWYGAAFIIVIIRYLLLGGQVCIPFYGWINLGVFYIVFAAPFFVGVINGINMTDGLDGLVSMPLIFNLIFFTIVGYLSYGLYIAYFALVFIPIIGCFLIFNLYPAKLLMGDSGAIFLGSVIAMLYILTGLEFFFPIVGFIFTANFFASFIQVIAIKKFGKKIFKMAPLHHHFELNGYKEQVIVYSTWVLSFCAACIGLLIFYFTI